MSYTNHVKWVTSVVCIGKGLAFFEYTDRVPNVKFLNGSLSPGDLSYICICFYQCTYLSLSAYLFLHTSISVHNSTRVSISTHFYQLTCFCIIMEHDVEAEPKSNDEQ
jgi:hypothetical protein